jgi:hypothetical protein
LAARTSTFSITGGSANNSETLAIKAAATRLEPNPEPGRSGRFLLDYQQAAFEKAFDLRFLSGFGFQSNKQSYFNRLLPPVSFIMKLILTLKIS